MGLFERNIFLAIPDIQDLVRLYIPKNHLPVYVRFWNITAWQNIPGMQNVQIVTDIRTRLASAQKQTPTFHITPQGKTLPTPEDHPPAPVQRQLMRDLNTHLIRKRFPERQVVFVTIDTREG
jgi:hypothetical protein